MRQRPRASRPCGARDTCWSPTPGNEGRDRERAMKEWLQARHRGLFIRSYVVLAGGLLLVAILLDLGFSALQSRQVRAADPWLVSTFQLMESNLAAVPAAQRAERADELGQRLGLGLALLEAGDIAGAALAEKPSELVDEAGKT